MKTSFCVIQLLFKCLSVLLPRNETDSDWLKQFPNGSNIIHILLMINRSLIVQAADGLYPQSQLSIFPLTHTFA